MSELKMKAEFEISSEHDTLSDLTALNQVAANDSARSAAPLRGSRRRIDAARLRMPRDDGFHLFRVY